MAANGGIMRCAASALGYFWDEEVVTYNAAAGCAVTHSDPRCIASCVAVARLASRVLLGVDVASAEKRREEVICATMAAERHLDGGDRDELGRAIDVAAEGLEALRLDDRGSIGYTYKPLGAACWAFVHAADFRSAITAITMEAGDADSNAVVAGALLGARFGFKALPPEWLREVPHRQAEWLEAKILPCLTLLGLS
mmetsp:Transcript_87609/g.247226  ORF Transcript_87609/g.247226 Transcript_87609/m.247226 type:complete len:197 (-) Transcript_87609:384-974(-)